MKKKLLSLLLASVTALSVAGGLAACGGNKGDGTILVWAPEEALPGFKSIESEFKTLHPEYANWNITWQAKGEGDANSQMSTDAAAGPNVFFFASDQLYQLAFDKHVLQPLTKQYVDIVKERDVQTAYEFATATDGNMYAFPATNDNCYFLWYDKTQVTADQAKSLDSLMAVAREKGKHILWNYETAWYAGMFYLGNTGLYMGYEDDAAYVARNYTTNIGGDVGQKVTKAMYSYLNPTNNGTGDNAVITSAGSLVGLGDGTAIAGIGGTWEKNTVVTALSARELDFDETIACTVLPTFKTADGTVYNLGSFAGPKYCGVNKLKDEKEIEVSLAFAEFLNSERGQLARYTSQGSGPSNKNAMNNATIKEDKVLQAAMAQMAADHSTIQGAQNDTFWNIHEHIAKPIVTGKATVNDNEVDVTEAQALELLASFAEALVAKSTT